MGGKPDDELTAARVLRCTACGAVVDACTVCRAGFLTTHVIRCRRDDGHDHATCATSRLRKVPSAPPPSAPRRKRR